ncbi:hypothetical protein T4D_308 [Trichinella pseudospiralis]|uniref:Uncharacterized protein n=1 Tax=Trichinella pseudospiralis TaxID=6337 RepID=A0A0V1F7P8_TRIPS|nr:hypothetical protein T4D_308 [Trichinella pseudospiralis]
MRSQQIVHMMIASVPRGCAATRKKSSQQQLTNYQYNVIKQSVVPNLRNGSKINIISDRRNEDNVAITAG